MIWRRPSQFVILLLMPFVLISILGTALGALNSDESPTIHAKLAIIQHDTPEEIQTAIESMQISIPEKERAAQMIESIDPITILLNDVLKSKELKDNITVTIFDHDLSGKEREKFSGVLEIPKNFTRDYYRYAFLSAGKAPELRWKLNQITGLEASFLTEILQTYQEEMSFWSRAHQAGVNVEQLQNKLTGTVGEWKTINEKKPISSVAYYAIGMCMMFIFYVASTSAGVAYEQKDRHIFDRILLANVPVPLFFTGIFITTAFAAFLQMIILFTLTGVIYDVQFPSILDFLMLTCTVCAMVGGFAVFISAISFRMKSDTMTSLFRSFLIPVFAFIGGSFFPVSQLGAIFETLSNYSPGGAGITAYIKLMQGYGFADITNQMIALMISTVLLVVAAIMIQPKRGGTV